MKSIVFITPADARHGFNLTGVRQTVPAREQIEDVVRGLMAEPAIGAIVIDERLIGERLREQLSKAERRWQGVLAVLPARAKVARPTEDYALRLIRRAIGYQVRLTP